MAVLCVDGGGGGDERGGGGGRAGGVLNGVMIGVGLTGLEFGLAWGLGIGVGILAVDVVFGHVIADNLSLVTWESPYRWINGAQCLADGVTL